jgi:hypothetical protein
MKAIMTIKQAVLLGTIGSMVGILSTMYAGVFSPLVLVVYITILVFFVGITAYIRRKK